MSIFTKIFSGNATDLVEGVGGVLDNLTTSKEEKWTDLLQLVLITVIGAYFGGRSFEKSKKLK